MLFLPEWRLSHRADSDEASQRWFRFRFRAHKRKVDPLPPRAATDCHSRSLALALALMAMRSSPVLDIRQQQPQPQPYPQLNISVPQQQQQQQQQQDSLLARSVALDTQPYTSAPPTRKQNTACDPCRFAPHHSMRCASSLIFAILPGAARSAATVSQVQTRCYTSLFDHIHPHLTTDIPARCSYSAM